jgi:hypothetical protein
VQIIFHSHHAVISPRMRLRAEKLVARLSNRIGHPVNAIVRFEQDGPTRRVELLLQRPRRRPLVAEGFGRTYGPALGAAAARLDAQIEHRKRTPRSRAPKPTRA